MSGTIKIHGKSYATVGKRVHDFRKKYPISKGWAIKTEIVMMDERVVVMKAEIVDNSGHTVAIGHAEEVRAASKINRTSALENAETSAIGRALAASGFTMDGIYATADEVLNAQRAERALPTKVGPDGSHDTWQQLAIDRGYSVPKIVAYFKKKKHPIPDPNSDRFDGFVEWLNQATPEMIDLFGRDE